MPSVISKFAVILAASSLLCQRAAADPPTPQQLEFFEKSVRPILATHCFECHGPKKQRSDLRVDSRSAMMTGGVSGKSMIPGKPEESLIIKAISYKEEDLRMPPKTKLTDKQIEIITTWVKQGAPWPETSVPIRPPEKDSGFKISDKDRAFWSFRPVASTPIPKVIDGSWPRNAIDHFVLATLEANKLRPVGPADKRTLIRRATFDLIGLPPTPEEIDAFLNDESPDAFARVVDRLLSSPHCGERWARHWLDVARYGEDQAHTFEARKYPQGFRYRDWIVRAFNEDMPYDRFVQEQIAADLLDLPERKENLPALGFFAVGPVYYGDAKKLDQYDDRIDTLSRGFLGLTVACARCHDHKFDPISTRDYYALTGVFASTDYVEAPLIPSEEVEKLKNALTEEQKKKKVKPQYPFTHAIKDTGKKVDMKVHLRGNPNTLGEVVPRRFPTILGGDDAKPFTKGSGRLELAQLIASKDNPLTARVMVNRIWKHHFGKGIVRTPSNFGKLGERPTHPELLDYLAFTFSDTHDWSIKKLHRDIMLSATYQLGSGSARNDKSNEVDADNKLLWRMNRRRLEVEAWRDAMLAVSGKLDRTMGGPSADLNSASNRRRTLYGVVSRHELNPLLRLFDFPDPNITSDSRTVTTVPLQQLFVLNSEFMAQNAKALAAQLVKEATSDEARIRHAFVLLYGRSASDRELKLGLGFLSSGEATAKGVTLSRWEQYSQVLLSANEFLYVD